MVKSIYSRWFNQFEFEVNGKCYKTNGGKFVYNELLNREIPLNWTVKKIGDFLNLYQPKTISEIEIKNNPGDFAVYGANGIVGYYYKKNHDKHEVTITCRGNTCGNLLMTMPDSWITGNSMVIGMDKNFNYKEYIYYNFLFADRKKFITGSAQPQITASNLSNYCILIPDERTLKEFEEIASSFRKQYIKINKSNIKLIELKEKLLPLLINQQLI